MSLVATRASIKYLSIAFFLKCFSVSWWTTHSDTWESCNLPQPLLTSASSSHRDCLCLKRFRGWQTCRISKKQWFFLGFRSGGGRTPLRTRCRQLPAGLRVPTCRPFSPPGRIRHWLQRLAGFAFPPSGKCSWGKTPGHSCWHWDNLCAGTWSCGASCTASPSQPARTARLRRPAARSAGDAPADGRFRKENWDDKIASVLL